MSDRVDRGSESSSVVPSQFETAVGSVEAYETGDATVLYDARNPLAWIESTEAVTIDDAN